ncbi:phage head-tail adapter protein [Lacticaseibacillus rhamnosus]|uniref:phage head-tail adapter protein n=1 Tax=Lacticaseibacillus rhamnosus TaxID=47715 RepID=UPI00237F03E7|nr:phage head-tail adapter protein [Lacticaseibacillus rhamnosus]
MANFDYTNYYAGSPTFKVKSTTSGDLRTFVMFYRQAPNCEGEPGDLPVRKVYEGWAQVYAPSQKDLTFLNSANVKEGVTIKIRDPHGDPELGSETPFIPSSSDYQVYIDDYRYKNKTWNIVDVRQDFENDEFVVLVLGYQKAGEPNVI